MPTRLPLLVEVEPARECAWRDTLEREERERTEAGGEWGRGTARASSGVAVVPAATLTVRGEVWRRVRWE